MVVAKHTVTRRYEVTVKRVLAILERVKQDKEYLVTSSSLVRDFESGLFMKSRKRCSFMLARWEARGWVRKVGHATYVAQIQAMRQYVGQAAGTQQTLFENLGAVAGSPIVEPEGAKPIAETDSSSTESSRVIPVDQLYSAHTNVCKLGFFRDVISGLVELADRKDREAYASEALEYLQQNPMGVT